MFYIQTDSHLGSVRQGDIVFVSDLGLIITGDELGKGNRPDGDGRGLELRGFGCLLPVSYLLRVLRSPSSIRLTMSSRETGARLDDGAFSSSDGVGGTKLELEDIESRLVGENGAVGY